MRPTALIAAALIAAAPAAMAKPHAHAAHPAAAQVSGAWSRPAAAGANGVGYLTLKNPGKTAETLVRVQSPWAGRVEMHTSSMAGGVMSMAAVDKVEIPAGGSVSFEPGGRHLMLVGLTHALKIGDKVPLTLSFANGTRVTTTLAVKLPGAEPEHDMGHMHH